MSSQSLQTGTGSSATLLCGLDMCKQPLPALLQLKEEPGDDEEMAMQAELQEHTYAFSKRSCCVDTDSDPYGTPSQLHREDIFKQMIAGETLEILSEDDNDSAAAGRMESQVPYGESSI